MVPRNSTACTGSSNLSINLASISAVRCNLTYAQETRHIIVRKPTERVSGGYFREERQYTAAIQYTD